MEEEAAGNKRRMLGNIKFIGELFKLKVIIPGQFKKCSMAKKCFSPPKNVLLLLFAKV